MDHVRFAVEPVPEEIDRGFEVQVFVNNVEMTRLGAGLGMDTNDLLIPRNRLRPQAEPQRVAVARCSCGVYGCGSTDVLITAENDVVHWDWLIEKPMPRRATFERSQYEQEVERLDADRSWETPERATVRLVASGCESDRLDQLGLRFGWASNHHSDRDVFEVSFTLNNQYQIFLWFPRNGQSPEQLADKVLATIAAEPQTWNARWHGMAPEARNQAPNIAGPNWSQHQL